MLFKQSVLTAYGSFACCGGVVVCCGPRSRDGWSHGDRVCRVVNFQQHADYVCVEYENWD